MRERERVEDIKRERLVGEGNEELTIGEDASTVRSALRENHSLAQVLEHGDGEHGRVLVRGEVLLALVVAVLVGLEPRLPLDVEEHEQLNR